MFPDKAKLFLCAIEDKSYKEEKIFCECFVTGSDFWLIDWWGCG